MPLINFIINLGALLLWLNWLSVPFDTLLKTSATSLVGTLKKAGTGTSKKWKYLAGLAGVIFLRAVVYWEIIPSLHWTPSLHLGIINLYFASTASHPFLQMVLFSLLSFLFVLGAFYLWLLLLSIANAKVPDTDMLQKLVRVHFRWLKNWPWPLKLIVPFFIGALFWLALHPLLAHIAIVPEVKSTEQLLKQSVLAGLGVYLAWKYLIVGILVLHLVHSYVYLGNHPFWLFINATARNLLFPIRWLPLRLGKFDFLPVLGIALILLLAEACSRLPARYPHYLPF